MPEHIEQLVSLLISSSVSDESLLGIISFLRDRLIDSSLSTFVSNSFSTLLLLQQWVWRSLTESFQSPSYTQLIETVAALNRKLIYDYGSIDLDTKASLIFAVTIDQINQIFTLIDQCEDDNDPFIVKVSLLFEDCAHFLHDNPSYDKLSVIEHFNQCFVSHYVMTDRYKMYLGQLRPKDLSASIFTARFLFYVKTCSFCCYSNFLAKFSRMNYTADEMISFIADDYIAITRIQSHRVATWSRELLGCMAQLVGLMSVLLWWDGQKGSQISVLLSNETAACNYVEDMIRMIAHEPFHQKTSTVRWNDETILMDSLLIGLYVIVQTQDINWFFRANPYIQEVIITVASAALNDEIGLCGYAVLGEVLNDDQLKDLKIGDNICNFFFTMLDEAWVDHGKTYKQMPIGHLLKGFQALAKNDCIQQRTASLNKILMFIDMCDQFPITYDIIWTLSFNTEIQEQLRSQNEFLAKLTQQAHHSTNDQLRKAVSGILWNLGPRESSEANESTIERDNFDIMISYCHKDKELCRRLYDELVQRKYRVWIDFDQMHGNVMDAMAQAIEQSPMVIICMSEDYRRSNFCRAEAQYAFQRQRKLVPVLLQKHYKPDGWLLFLIGQLLYVDFTKHEFTKAMGMLLKELHPHPPDPPAPPTCLVKKQDRVTTHPGASAEPVPRILEWSKEQVQEWLTSNGLLQLSRLLKHCDGRSLLYLHRYLRNDDKPGAIQLLAEDAKRQLNEHLSLIELCQLQSLIDRERRSSHSTPTTVKKS